MAQVPTDPAIPGRALQGRGGKTQEGHPLIAPSRDIPERLADLGQRTQVMMVLHEFLVPRLFQGKNGPDKNLPQVQGSSFLRKNCLGFFYTLGEEICPYFSATK